MKYRIASMLASEDASTAATKTLDITLNKPISRITIQYKAVNGDSVPKGHPAKMVPKIEIVDGSNVLYSLSGIEAQALTWYETGRMPVNLLTYISGIQSSAVIELNFGRHLWDEQLALDPKKFQNPQLKITHDRSKGGATPASSTLSVFAHVFDEQAAAPTGFLMSKEQYSYTLAAGAKKQIDLPTDFPYRLLMLQSLYAGKQPHENYAHVKLSEDNDARVLINDELTTDLFKLLHEYPRLSEQILAADLDGHVTIYCTPTYLMSIAALGLDAVDAALFADQSFGGTFDATGTNAKASQWLVTGEAPHGAMAIFMGKKDIIDDWYDVAKVGNLRLTVTAGAAAVGTNEIITQQLKTYAGAAA